VSNRKQTEAGRLGMHGGTVGYFRLLFRSFFQRLRIAALELRRTFHPSSGPMGLAGRLAGSNPAFRSVPGDKFIFEAPAAAGSPVPERSKRLPGK
jgi:hypothetical protein